MSHILKSWIIRRFVDSPRRKRRPKAQQITDCAVSRPHIASLYIKATRTAYTGARVRAESRIVAKQNFKLHKKRAQWPRIGNPQGRTVCTKVFPKKKRGSFEPLAVSKAYCAIL